MAAEAAARSSSRAAGTETRVACDEATIWMKKIDQCSPCSVRVHGPMLIFEEARKIGDLRSKELHDGVRTFDHRMKVTDLSVFGSHTACRDLIHRMLAEGPVTRDYDLAYHNWEDFQPNAIATTIVAKVRRASEDARGVVHAYAFDIDIEMSLTITSTYSEPKALLLACRGKAAEAAGASARGRKRRRRETTGELCTICFSEVETQEEETARLPCSHSFHSRCIAPWFHRASTCPTCRRDAMEYFGSVRSVSIESS